MLARPLSLLVLCLAACANAFHLPAAARLPGALRARQLRLSSAEPEEGEPKSSLDDDALAAAFAKRLEQEGGATQFKIKTTISGAADELKDGAGKLAGEARNAAELGKDGLLKADAWQLIVGLLAATVLFSVVNAANRQPAVDRFTSDGSTLEFGQRSPQREYNPYQPQYGVGQ